MEWVDGMWGASATWYTTFTSRNDLPSCAAQMAIRATSSITYRIIRRIFSFCVDLEVLYTEWDPPSTNKSCGCRHFFWLGAGRALIIMLYYPVCVAVFIPSSSVSVLSWSRSKSHKWPFWLSFVKQSWVSSSENITGKCKQMQNKCGSGWDGLSFLQGRVGLVKLPVRVSEWDWSARSR